MKMKIKFSFDEYVFFLLIWWEIPCLSTKRLVRSGYPNVLNQIECKHSRKTKKNKKETESNQWRKSGKASEEKIEYCTKHRIEKKEI